jgi:AbiU2
MAKSLMDPKVEFEKTLDAVISLLRRAKDHLAVGRGSADMITSEPAISHAAPSFWVLTIYAHFDAALLFAFKLFDTQKRALTIPHLLSLAEKSPGIFQNATVAQVQAIVKSANDQLAGIKDSIESISNRRNRVIAHLESTAVLDPTRLEAETKVTISDLNKAFLFAADILNELSVALRDMTPDFQAIGITDYENLGRLVVDAKCEQIRKYEAEFGPWDGPRPKNCHKNQ